ncbi:O-methyltransferase [Parvicella tangerina]|uniref:tRNA 5-hydroxyuridine methyltransferase n=1 Tax=Parvicella tangerina TaxID=2829795 RepID=A0A916ND51_9FLAO|nr:O-methyltransferase [Parvicella tangerina]CAG5086273.1 tRNA 5-hydroxyuridine methyltransferase [Parvicella tangerina]
MDFLPEEIDNYAVTHTSKESELLYRLNRATNMKVLQPRMLSGHLQGRVLSMLSNMIQPRHILEIGTYTGYSALCLAEGLAMGGKLLSIEIDPEIAEFAKDFIEASEYAEQIEVVVGNAMQTIDTINEQIDLVFIDADKSNYLNYLKKVYPKLKVGGYIIADNVLWSGKVVKLANEKDMDTKALQEFNQFVQEDDRFENVLMPIRDGLMVARKLK